ncbi:GNAT family N-acetyltransferase [Actinoplanes sp. LDG1-06]|uniref:GNAT family N-acetyltransferase n=1 Tax=Paractinoplanes ovalisporus TaxID=2810368 RepID=A0ABS2AGZ3_9ACTN|nr:GNAT family N-acetyltransferase [Actinoplanes ovalisporus]MBM2619072.1 GNAT family N-acetyltransferase [Actinoplanes ovalisporus]
MTGIRIEPSGPADAEALGAVYADAFGRPPFDEGPEVVAAWRDESLPQHAARAGFRCLAAWDDDLVVGFTYGYTGEYGQWWTDQIAAVVPPALAAEWLGGHFELVELAVRPSHERRGIGAGLHDRLLDGLSHRVALLTATDDATAPARRLYHRKGWEPLADHVFEGSTLMGKRLS